MKGILFMSIRQQHIIDWNSTLQKTLMLLFWDSALFPLERFLSNSKSVQNKRGGKPQSRKTDLLWPSCTVFLTEGIFQRKPPTRADTSPRTSLSTATYYLNASLKKEGLPQFLQTSPSKAASWAVVDPSNEHHHWCQGATEATPGRQPHFPGSGICRIRSFWLERIIDMAGTLLCLALFCTSITHWNSFTFK